MYYSMNGTGSIGEAVLVDSQNPTAGAYDPATHEPVSTATRTWYDQLFSTANKALDVFNPNIPNPAPAPATNTKWILPTVLGLGAALGIAYYVTRAPKKKN